MIAPAFYGKGHIDILVDQIRFVAVVFIGFGSGLFRADIGKLQCFLAVSHHRTDDNVAVLPIPYIAVVGFLVGIVAAVTIGVDQVTVNIFI